MSCISSKIKFAGCCILCSYPFTVVKTDRYIKARFTIHIHIGSSFRSITYCCGTSSFSSVVRILVCIRFICDRQAFRRKIVIHNILGRIPARPSVTEPGSICLKRPERTVVTCPDYLIIPSCQEKLLIRGIWVNTTVFFIFRIQSKTICITVNKGFRRFSCILPFLSLYV